MKSHNSGAAQAVTILATATLIKGYDVEPRLSLAIANVSTSTIYIGYDSGVTTSTGFPVVPNERISDDMYHGNIYGIVASGTAEVRLRYY